jgi:hypothetical protein
MGLIVHNKTTPTKSAGDTAQTLAKYSGLQLHEGQ